MSKALEKFQQHTNDFLDALALIGDRQRNIAPEGEWSAAYIVHHVADGELHFAARYFFTLGSENPTMVLFDEDRYPEALHYDKRSITKSLAAIVGIRSVVFEILSTIEEQAWSRVTTSEDGTSYTLEALVAKADDHISAHAAQLRTLAASL
jgi:hypothetical protein